MGKILAYISREYNFQEHELIQVFGNRWSRFKDSLEQYDLSTEHEEKHVFNLIDEFMEEYLMEQKRRRRAY